MTRIVGPPRSRRRHWTVTVALLVPLAIGVLFIPSALAIHDLKFQLDGDVSLHCYTVPNNCSTQTVDWGGNTNNTSSADTGNGLFTVSDSGGSETVSAN